MTTSPYSWTMIATLAACVPAPQIAPLAPTAAGSAPRGAASEVRLDWLERDLAVARLLTDVLPRAGQAASLASFRDALGEVNERGDEDIGCGARRTQLAKYGGHTTTWIYLIVDDTGSEPMIAELHLSQSGSMRDTWPHYADRLGAEWGDLATLGENGFDYGYVDERASERLRLARAQRLGVSAHASVPAELEHAFQVLTEARHVYDVGQVCYYGGSEPIGRTAIEALNQSGRVDLVRSVLRGANPEGRVYAAEALQAAGWVDGSDARVIETLRSWNEVPISTCSGCFVTKSVAAELLAGE
jgi:hypothetical protein